MNKYPSFLLAVTLLFLAPCMILAQESTGEPAADEGSVEVLEATICTGVTDREPEDTTQEVSVSLDNVYCHTRIKNEGPPTTITHVWYFNGQKMAEVPLDVGTSPGWRTWSSKRLWKGWVGDWKVVVEDENGTPLEEIAFTTTDEPGSQAQQ